MPYTRYTDEEIIEAVRAHNGLISRAAKQLGVGAGVIYERRKAVPAVDDAIREAREGLVDLAEEGLRYHLEQKAPWAIALALKTIGKNRGFSERLETLALSDEKLAELLTDEKLIQILAPERIDSFLDVLLAKERERLDEPAA